MNQTNMMEMEQPISKRIVIFGATGDLARRKLVPALFKLWEKNLLPQNFLIVGASRREITRQEWLTSLGDYPDEFVNWLDFQSCDLSNEESLHVLHDDSADTTYFLSVPPHTYSDAVHNLKTAGFLDDPESCLLYTSDAADEL